MKKGFTSVCVAANDLGRSMSTMIRYLLLLGCCLVANSEFVTKKFCRDVDVTQCRIHNVIVDPCPAGPGYCIIKRTKMYSISVDYTPGFKASNMRMSISADDRKVGKFLKMVKRPQNACPFTTCPFDVNSRRIFDTTIVLDKSFPMGKYPLQVKLWNPEDKTKSCCFTFNVKIFK